MTLHQTWLVPEPLNARLKDFLPFWSILPHFFSLLCFFTPLFSFVYPVEFCFVLGFSFCLVLLFFLLLQALESPERADEQRKKIQRTSSNFWELFVLNNQPQRVNVLETFRSLSPSSLQLPMSKGISTLKGSSNARLSSFKATFPWEPAVSVGRVLSCSLNGIICHFLGEAQASLKDAPASLVWGVYLQTQAHEPNIFFFTFVFSPPAASSPQ